MNTCKNFILVEHNIKVNSLIWLWLHVFWGYLDFWWNLGPAPTCRARQILFSLNITTAKPIKGYWRKPDGPGILEEVAIDVPGFLSSGSFWVVFLSPWQCSLGFSWLRRTGCTDEGDGIKSCCLQLPKYNEQYKNAFVKKCSILWSLVFNYSSTTGRDF